MSEHHEGDLESIPPQEPTPDSIAASARVASVLALLDEYGFTYTEEPGWEARNPTYLWYNNADGEAPYGIMVHHSATASYAPKRAYPKPHGDRTDGRTICNILIQPDGTINLVSSDPANYSSGVNWKGILTEFVQKEVRFHGPQSGPLGPEWYGNRAWINIEVVNEGLGGPIPSVQEEALIGVCVAICYIFDWDATAVIGHYDGRSTKPDPRW